MPTIPIWGSLSRKTEGTLDILTTLRDSGLPTVAVTTPEAAIEFDPDKYLTYDAVVNIEGVTGITAAAYWTIQVETSDAINGAFVPLGTLRLTTNGPGRYRISLFADNAAIFTANPAFIRVNAVLTGTAGALGYNCYLAKNINMA